MASNINRDAEGLQAVEQNDFPEVVPGQQSLRNPLDRQSSLSRPEAYSPPQPQGNDKPNSHPYGGSFLPESRGNSDYHSPAPPQYAQDYPSKHVESQEKPTEKKILGMRKKVFIWVASIVAIIVVLAIVLGAVLGTVLPSDSKSSSSSNGNGNGSGNNGNGNGNGSGNQRFHAKDKTGIAMLSPAGQSSLFTYYIDNAGAIIEVEYPNGNWNQDQDSPPKTTNITSIGHGADSPIAAISYTLQGNTQYRQIFFFDSNGLVSTSNTTGNGNWSTPYAPVTDISSQPNTMSLAACADTTSNALNGIRVYFGSSNQVIQEIGMDFPESSPDPIWHDWATFPGSDATAGVGCAIVNGYNHLYFRNSTTSRLQQWTWNYVDVTAWTIGANSTVNNGVAEGGSIAVTTDAQNTDYIFYQDTNKQTVLAEYTGSGPTIGDPMTGIKSINAAPNGYTLAATWASGAIVLNQNSTMSTELLFSSVSRNGDAKGSSTQTGRNS